MATIRADRHDKCKSVFVTLAREPIPGTQAKSKKDLAIFSES
jgi:hypothetical protein